MVCSLREDTKVHFLARTCVYFSERLTASFFLLALLPPT